MLYKVLCYTNQIFTNNYIVIHSTMLYKVVRKKLLFKAFKGKKVLRETFFGQQWHFMASPFIKV